jgi:hypothetical protein
MQGQGFGVNGGQSLIKAYSGSSSTITNRYGDTWAFSDLMSALSTIIGNRQADVVATLDYLSDYGKLLGALRELADSLCRHWRPL